MKPITFFNSEKDQFFKKLASEYNFNRVAGSRDFGSHSLKIDFLKTSTVKRINFFCVSVKLNGKFFSNQFFNINNNLSSRKMSAPEQL